MKVCACSGLGDKIWVTTKFCGFFFFENFHFGKDGKVNVLINMIYIPICYTGMVIEVDFERLCCLVGSAIYCLSSCVVCKKFGLACIFPLLVYVS